MQRLLTLVLVMSTLLTSCGDTTEKKEPTTDSQQPVEKLRSSFNEEGTQKLMNLLNDYYALKDALVASDAAKASEAAVTIQVSADSLEKFIKDSTHILYTYTKEIKTSAGAIVIAKQEVEKQRIPFEKVSDAVYTLAKEANLKNAGIYRQYCPMAFNDKGAYWLSSGEKIRNPYFGKKMLTCGEVTDTLK